MEISRVEILIPIVSAGAGLALALLFLKRSKRWIISSFIFSFLSLVLMLMTWFKLDYWAFERDCKALGFSLSDCAGPGEGFGAFLEVLFLLLVWMILSVGAFYGFFRRRPPHGGSNSSTPSSRTQPR